MTPTHPNEENGINSSVVCQENVEILNLGYDVAYRRVFRTLGSVGAVISVAS